MPIDDLWKLRGPWSARIRHAGWLFTRFFRHARHRVTRTSGRTWQRAARNAAAVSFDVFDTALFRCVPEPADVFEIVAYRLRERGQLAIDPLAYRELRIRAESSARAEAARAGREEVSLREIHLRLNALLPEAHADAGVAEELAVECAVLVPNPDVKAAYDALARRGLKVAFVSDTYFPEAFVRERLAALGFTGDHRVFTSSAYGATKARGTLFAIVAREMDAEAGRMVHLGDNRRADVVMGSRSGVRAYWYRPVVRSVVRDGPDPALGERITARLEALSTLSPGLSAEQRALTALGVGTMGPMFVGFTQWLARCLEDEPTELVLYCARDGYLIARLMELFERHAGFEGARYFEVSRRALNIPTIAKVDARAIGVLCANHAPLAVREYFARIGVEVDRYAAVVRECGLETDRIVATDEDRARLGALFVRLEETVVAAARAELPLLLEYCAQAGCFDASDITIVDIGWGGTLQASLAALLASQGRAPVMRGYYLATDERIHLYGEAAGSIASWLIHGAQPPQLAAIVSQGYWMLEMAFSAPHGTVLGYRREGERIVPVLQTYERDAPESRAGRIFQGESYRFAERWKAIFDGIGPSIPAAAALRRFESIVARPPLRLARFFGEIVHVGGLGNTREDQPIAKPPSLREWIRRPGTLRERYARSPWKRAYLTRLLGSHRVVDLVLRVRTWLRALRYGVRWRT